MGGPNPSAFPGLPLSGGTITGALSVTGALTASTLALGGAAIGGNVLAANGAVVVTGSVGQGIDVASVGTGYKTVEGANAKQGIATLAAGTVVVANTNVTANSRIFITGQSLGTVTVFSAYGVSARTAGTSFTILASQATDTSVVAWEIFEPG